MQILSQQGNTWPKFHACVTTGHPAKVQVRLNVIVPVGKFDLGAVCCFIKHCRTTSQEKLYMPTGTIHVQFSDFEGWDWFEFASTT